MSKKDNITEVIHLVEGKKENLALVIDSIEKFFENLNLEIENWKVSMEEFQDGTRIFIRFQILVKR